MEHMNFVASDFNVFKIDGLDQRMDALKDRIQPKLQRLGKHFSQELSSKTGDEMFMHVAKHARRTINPPNDTWVAFARNSRGYKMMPHFQIGLWETHIFVWFAVIYEAQGKTDFGKVLEQNAEKVKEIIPNHFVWSIDHTKPDIIPHEGLSVQELKTMFQRLQTVKKAEILCGIQVPREDAIKISNDGFVTLISNAFDHLIPLYKFS
ncbi:DUF1054 domain-containing protein [Peribacillus cavernae]|uniref:UPF0637 protein ELQ35_08175 n=1 Tax=Peribacillus cavernae TaxID=1674310 RepID=A0A3S0VQ45_9BACI|nr:DUF1054 domain-containing protein [Peribacillus cavernae]MDQ0217224.1 uncharacterized protein YktB (UPF0637 family) [Peribacillus cavernae]RUQ30305.1 DUF1054 domain-containing protein [Peribacillus cavernae]